jgi:hypothetical protein
MPLLRLNKTAKPRQPLFGHGSLINPSAEHTILDPFQPPQALAAQIYQSLSGPSLAAEAARAVNPLDTVVIAPDNHQPGLPQPLPSID